MNQVRVLVLRGHTGKRERSQTEDSSYLMSVYPFSGPHAEDHSNEDLEKWNCLPQTQIPVGKG